MPEIDQDAAPKSPRGASDDQDRARSHFTRENDGINDEEQPEAQREYGHRKNHQSALPPELLIELFFRFRRATRILLGQPFPAEPKTEIERNRPGEGQAAEHLQSPWRDGFVSART